ATRCSGTITVGAAGAKLHFGACPDHRDQGVAWAPRLPSSWAELIGGFSCAVRAAYRRGRNVAISKGSSFAAMGPRKCKRRAGDRVGQSDAAYLLGQPANCTRG